MFSANFNMVQLQNPNTRGVLQSTT